MLISVENEEARTYYLEEARKLLWSVRELQRQINSFYYERLLENRGKKRGGKKAAITPLPKAHRSKDEGKVFVAKEEGGNGVNLGDCITFISRNML